MGMTADKLIKAVLFMTLFSTVFGLFGCKKAPDTAEHDVSEITGVSISCGNPDRNGEYSFNIQKKDDLWLFDTQCYDRNGEKIEINGLEISENDVDEVLEILERNDSIVYAENYKKRKIASGRVADEITYGFCLTFADGKRYTTCDVQGDLEKMFYRFAEKYGETTLNR